MLMKASRRFFAVLSVILMTTDDTNATCTSEENSQVNACFSPLFSSLLVSGYGASSPCTVDCPTFGTAVSCLNSNSGISNECRADGIEPWLADNIQVWGFDASCTYANWDSQCPDEPDLVVASPTTTTATTQQTTTTTTAYQTNVASEVPETGSGSSDSWISDPSAISGSWNSVPSEIHVSGSWTSDPSDFIGISSINDISSAATTSSGSGSGPPGSSGSSGSNWNPDDNSAGSPKMSLYGLICTLITALIYKL